MKGVIITFILGALTFSQSVFANTKIYQVKIHASNQEVRNQVANLVHPDHLEGNYLYSVVREADLEKLKAVVGKNLVEIKLIDQFSDKGLSDEYQFPSGDERFHTYSEVMAELDRLHMAYPELTELFEIGKSVEGRAIKGIKIAPKFKMSLPAILFVGTHHAREHLSTEIPLMLIEKFLKDIKADENFRKLMSQREVYIVPLLNPDGAMHDIKGRRYKWWRKNRTDNTDGSKGVDLNRNYSFGWGTGGSSSSPRSDVYMGPAPFSEPETIAIRKFVESKENLKVLLSFHTFSELILYPWGGKKDDVTGKDGQLFKKMATDMAKWNNYRPMQASDLYIASGDTCDWAYGEHGIVCFTFELSPKSQWNGGFYPGAKIIDKVFQANIEPAKYLINYADDPYRVLND